MNDQVVLRNILDKLAMTDKYPCPICGAVGI